MSEHRKFFTGDILPESFVNALEEHVSLAISPTFKLSKLNTTTLQIVAGATGATQVNVGIAGAFRKITSTISGVAPANGAGTYPIYITTSTTDYALEDLHLFDYSFALKLATAPTGSGTEALSAQIGTYDWDGSAITKVLPWVGSPLPDGPQEVASQRSLGFTSQQAMPGNAHPSPPAHVTTHQPGGSDAVDWTLVNLIGSLGARPSAAAANAGLLYFAIDDNGGRLSRSNGATWDNLTIGLTDSRLTNARAPTAHASTHAPGPGDSDPIDYTQVHMRGTIASRPTASANNNGLFYWAFDDNNGSLYRSKGDAWELIATNVSAPATGFLSIKKSIIPAQESITGGGGGAPVSFATMPTPDRVTNIVMQQDGIMVLYVDALWRSSGSFFGYPAEAALFLNGQQLQVPQSGGGITNQLAEYSPFGFFYGNWRRLVANGSGLQTPYWFFLGGDAANDNTLPTVLSANNWWSGITAFDLWNDDGGGTIIRAPAGTYTVEIRWKPGQNTRVDAKERRMWVYTLGFATG